MDKVLTILIRLAFLIFSFGIFLLGFFPDQSGENCSGYEASKVVAPPSWRQRHVGQLVLVIIDALRADFVLDLPGQPHQPYKIEYLSQLLGEGRALGIPVRASPPTVTLPRIKAITTGSVAGFVDVLRNFASQELGEDSLLHQWRTADRRMILYGDDTWSRLFPGFFIREDPTTSFFVSDFTEVDDNVTRHLDEELGREDWDVMILHYLGLDHIGHLEGPQSELIPAKLSEMGKVLAKIHTGLARKSSSTHNVEATPPPAPMVVVMGDHGMADGGGHGGASGPEVTVPVVFISDALQVEAEKAGRMDREYLQVDLAPTLALLTGVPIPRRSMGQLILPAVQAAFLRANTTDVMPLLLRHNSAQLASLSSSPSCHQIYEAALKLSAASESDQLLHASEQLSAASDQFSSAMACFQNDLARRIDYDLYTILLGVGMLLACLAISDPSASIQQIITGSSYPSITGGLGTILVIVGGQLLFCHEGAKSQLCDRENPSSLAILVIGAFLITVAVLEIVAAGARISPSQVRFYSKLGSLGQLMSLSLAGQTLSLLSSSFIEEEHQAVYFILTSVLVISLYLTVWRDCSASRSDCGRSSNYCCHTICDGSANEHPCCRTQFGTTNKTDGHDERNERSTGIKFTNRSESSKAGGNSAIWYHMAALVLHRLLRSMNQTGDKWRHLPDAADWMNQPENLAVREVLLLASVAYCCFFRGLSVSQNRVVSLVWTCVSGGLILLQKHEPTSLLLPRAIYALLIIGPVAACRQGNFRRHLLQTVVLLCLVLQPPTGVICVALLLLLLEMLDRCELSQEDGEAALVAVLMARVAFFYLGNSNGLATVAVGAGYTGVGSYLPTVVSTLLALHTFTGPLIVYAHYAAGSECRRYRGGSKSERYADNIAEEPDIGYNAECRTGRCNQNDGGAMAALAQSFFYLSGCQATLFSILCTALRFHLFVWTVFSPKLLYMGMEMVVTTVFFIICVMID